MSYTRKNNTAAFLCFALQCCAVIVMLLLIPASAIAATAPTCASGGTTVKNCDENCISSAAFQNFNSGSQIISAMFGAINDVLGSVENNFYTTIIGDQTFQQAIGVAITLYVAIYGLMITFSLSSYKTGEVANRLMKVGIVYLMTAQGAWDSFNQFVSTPVITTMNQLIQQFNMTAEGMTSSYASTGGSGILDVTGFSTMFSSSLTTVFSVQMITAVFAMMKTFPFGWLCAFFLLWALIDFLFMMLGALITYAKCLIGLAFLLGIAPIFFILLLFEKSRPIFFVWVSQVVVFALQPVMLFGFLSFYVALITQASFLLLTDPSGNQTDFCWLKWFSLPGSPWETYMWTPTHNGQYRPGVWYDASGNVIQEPINMRNLIYFVILCYLGKTFCNFIQTLTSDLANSSGTRMIRGSDIMGGFRGSVGKTIKAYKNNFNK